LGEILGTLQKISKKEDFCMATLINGKELAQKIRTNLKDEVEDLKSKGINPKLAVIMVGEDKASKVYVKNKSKACDEIGIEFEEFLMDETTTMPELLELIEKLNNRKDIHGILLQSPIPKNLDINQAFNAIDYRKDVDGFHPINVGKLSIGEDCFISCTPYGVIKMLEEYNIPIEGKNAVILGRSNIVGKPLIQCMLKKNATVTVCHSRTQNIGEITKNADILIVAIGKAKFVTEDMVKDGAVVIDVGINRTDEGKLVGDVDFENVEKKASYITPVPGGVGPMTIAMLMNNVVKAAELSSKE
jgi:methylenetetrahydrofolate dehydrogenase (NADP+)/methenyltetrahydrofolate cyclohydrolase